MRNNNETIFNLYFITTGSGVGNCSQVVTLTKEIIKSGNTSAYGIIDWDLSNSPEDRIFVHGHNKRYSIENYIYDPIFLVILYLEQGGANNVHELGYNSSTNQYSIPDEPDTRLQTVCDWFIARITAKFPSHANIDQVEVEYLNGKKIKIASWYLTMKGHDLENKLKEVFPSLSQFRNEGDLQKKLSDIIGKCYPFVPKDSYDLLKQLATNY
jgi:hypothetical protein